MIQNLLLLLNAVVAVALVLVILLQRQDTSGGGIMGGANMGAAPVTRNPLAKTTTYLAILFMGSSLLLAVMSTGQGKSGSVFDKSVEVPAIEKPEATETPIPVPVPTPEVPQ
ncbi:MAG: preprotein translocase subunit SecG [Alphaproteobacteria bacterium]|nr:preprotein translocase subunit SecG [Alphaproteobacteria bacterium]MDD9920217.1 preprotein translocase subunit SecG [Alphaproteobacteria bacterium]